MKAATGPVEIEARIDRVRQTTLATTLGQGETAIQTVEHVLAAISGLQIDNLLIELDGPEIPIMDGSARAFAEALSEAGIVPQAAPREVLAITQPFEVGDGAGSIAAFPSSQFEVEGTVEYDEPVGRQSFTYTDEGPATFLQELAGARTFCFLEDIERLKAAGLIKGGSLDNALVIGPDGAINLEGYHWPNELARHKVLDLMGDLALLGRPLRGRLRTFRAGHTLHAKFAAYLASHPEVWTVRTEGVTEAVPVAL